MDAFIIARKKEIVKTNYEKYFTGRFFEIIDPDNLFSNPTNNFYALYGDITKFDPNILDLNLVRDCYLYGVYARKTRDFSLCDNNPQLIKYINPNTAKHCFYENPIDDEYEFDGEFVFYKGKWYHVINEIDKVPFDEVLDYLQSLRSIICSTDNESG